mgnify:CR=1 FL=1
MLRRARQLGAIRGNLAASRGRALPSFKASTLQETGMEQEVQVRLAELQVQATAAAAAAKEAQQGD